MFPLWIALVFAVGGTVLGQVLPPKCPPYVHFYCACDPEGLAEVVPVKMCLYQQYEGLACHPCHNSLQEYVNCNTCPKNTCPICSSQIFGLHAPYSTGLNSIEKQKTVFFKFSKDLSGVYYLPPSAVYNKQPTENDLIPSNSIRRLKEDVDSKNDSLDSKKDKNKVDANSTLETKEVVAKTEIIFDDPNLQAAHLRASNLQATNMQASNFPAFHSPVANLQASNFPVFHPQFQASNLPVFHAPAANLQALSFPAFDSPANHLRISNFPAANPQAANFPASNLQSPSFYAANFPAAYSYQKPYIKSRRDITQKEVAYDINEDKTLKRKHEFRKNGSNQRQKRSYDIHLREHSVKRGLSSKLERNINNDKYGSVNYGKGQLGNMAQSDLPMRLVILETGNNKLVGLKENTYGAGFDQGYSEKGEISNYRGKNFGYGRTANEWNFKPIDLDTKDSRRYVLDDYSLSFKNFEMLPFKNYSSIEELHKAKKGRSNPLIGNEGFVNIGFNRNHEGSQNFKYPMKSKRSGLGNKVINPKTTIYLEDGSNIQYMLQNNAIKSNASFPSRALTSANLLDLDHLSNGIGRNKCTVNDIRTFPFTYSVKNNTILGYEFMCTILKKSNKLEDIKSNVLTNENVSKDNEHFFSRKELLPLVEDILRCLLDQKNERFTVITNELKVDISDCQFTMLPNFMMKLIKNNDEINFENAGIMQKSKIQKFKIIQTLFSTVQLEITSIINYIISPSSSIKNFKDAKNRFIIITGQFNFEVNLLLQSNQSSMISSNQSLWERNMETEPTQMFIKNKSSDYDKLFPDVNSNLKFSFFAFPSGPKQKPSNDETKNIVPKLDQETRQKNSHLLYRNEFLPFFTSRKHLNKEAVSKPRIFYYSQIFFDSNKHPKTNNYPFSIESRRIFDENETKLVSTDDELHKRIQTSNLNKKFKISNLLKSGADNNWFNFFDLPTIDNILFTVSNLFSSLPFYNSSSQTNKGPENYLLSHVGNTAEKHNITNDRQILLKILKMSTQNNPFFAKDNETLGHKGIEHLFMTDDNNENTKARATSKVNQLKTKMKYINGNYSSAIEDVNNYSDEENGASKHQYNLSKSQIVSELNQKYNLKENNKKLGAESSAEIENKLPVIIPEENFHNSSKDVLYSPENLKKIIIDDGQNASENEIPHEKIYLQRRLLQFDHQKENDAEDVIDNLTISDSNPSRSKRSYNLPYNNWCTISKMSRHGDLECTVWTYKKECILKCHEGHAINNKAREQFVCNRKSNQWQPIMEGCKGSDSGGFGKNHGPMSGKEGGPTPKPNDKKYVYDSNGDDEYKDDEETYYDEPASEISDKAGDGYEDDSEYDNPEGLLSDSYKDDYDDDSENEDYKIK